MKQKPTHRVLAMALSIFLMVGMMPVSAVKKGVSVHTGEEITLSAQAVPHEWSSMSNAWSWMTVNGTISKTTVIHFAGNRWYVVGYNGGGVASAPGTMTLFSVSGIGEKDCFNPAVKDGSQYIHSHLRDELTNGERFAGIDAREKSVMVHRTLDGVTGEWPKDQLWALSIGEATLMNSDLRKNVYNGVAAYWWLRSPGNPGYQAATVTYTGDISANGNYVHLPCAIRPAFNLDLASVIFASAAEGGKAEDVGQKLSAATAPTSGAKLTVVDSNTDNLSLSVAQAVINDIEGKTYVPGNTVNIDYSDAKIGTGKYVSCVIADNNVGNNYGKVTHYGKLSQSANGTASFTVPSDLADGSYTIKLFNEECNGDKKTDYASAPVEVQITIEKSVPTPTPTATPLPDDGAIFLENEYLKIRIASSGNKGGVVSSLIYKSTGLDLTGTLGADDKGGLFRDRMPGIAELWNELEYEAEIVENTEDIVTALVKSIPSEKSQGIVVRKYYTLRKGSSSIETNWEITNAGDKSISTAPWVWCNVIPGKTDKADYYLPTEKEGLYKDAPSLSCYPSRNWLGAIDEKDNISISFVVDYNKLAMEYTWLDRVSGYTMQEWAYKAIVLAPGESWDTTFYTNVVPLQEENALAYASPEVNAGIMKWQDLEASKENNLEMVLSSVGTMGDVEIEIEITGPDGYKFTVQNKFNVNLSNQTPVKVNWTWTPPSDGVYLLKAGLYKDGIKQQLGKTLQNPSPDIEVPLVVGKYPKDTILFPAWPRDSSGGGSGQRKISGDIISKDTNMVVWSVPSLEKIFLDDIVDLENSPVKVGLAVDLAKREREAVQVVISPEEGKDFNGCYVAFGEFKNENGKLLPEGSLKYNPVGYVFTKSGSRFDPNIRTGYWPDPLLESKNFDVKGGQNTPIWITVYADPDVEQGIYEGNLTIKTNEETISTIPMSINVWSFSLPETPKLETALDFKNIPVDQIDLYIDNFLEHRITPRGALRYPSVTSLRQDPDFVQFDAKVESLLKKGLNTIMVNRDLYTDPTLAERFVEHLKEKGWLDMTYVYLADEPAEDKFPELKAEAAKWKSVVPDLKLMVTTYPKEELADTVDLWCVPAMHDNPQEAQKALERGEELWWYHTDPPHPQANFLIDMPAVTARATFWQSWQGYLNTGYTGFLYSFSTWGGPEDPWTEPGPFLSRNGLESQIYPSPDGPVNSIRWEVMRDGVEDYDYCSLLWDLLQRVEKEMPGKVNKKDVIKAKSLLEFPVPLSDFVGKQNIVEETGKWRKELAESIISITALLESDTYTVFFDSKGGSEIYDIEVPSSGSTITAPAVPTKEGYRFAGWYKETVLENEWNFEADIVTSDITLYAKWIEAETPAGFIIRATYDGKNIDSGTVVLAGKELVITVVGKDSDSYTYAWSGTGTSEQTTDSITINPLTGKVDATCTVSGLNQEPTPTPTPTPIPPEPPTYPETMSAPTPTPVLEVKVEEGKVTTTIPVKPTTNVNGKAVAEISGIQLADAIAKAVTEAAKQGKNTEIAIRIEVSASTDAKAAGVDLTAEALKIFVESKADTLTISTQFGTMIFDEKTAVGILKQSEGEITITATKVEAEELVAEIREKVGERPVVSFDITCSEKTISQLGGKAIVTIPYILKAGENPNAIVAYYINSAGKFEAVRNCKYDSVTGTISFKTPHFSKYAIAYNKVDFADVADSAWYHDAVTFAAAREITAGVGKVNFGSDETVTRAQALVMIMKAFGISPDGNAENNFSDAENSYYTGYLAAAKNMGITSGVGDNKFAPDRQMTRQELFVLVYNTLNSINELPIATTAKGLADFKDAGEVANYSNEAIELFVKAGIISGTNGNILPGDFVSRAQFVQILYNIMAK